jgi:hypothetical protein
MIILNSSSTVQVVLGAAVAATQAAVYASYVDVAADGSTFAPGMTVATSNGTTPVTVVSSPASGNLRQVKYISVFNSDTIPMAVTISAASTALITRQLTVGATLEYVDSAGFGTVVAAVSSGGQNDVDIITQASTSTMVPATHAGLTKYIRCSGDVTFNTAQGYSAGEVYNIHAVAALDLLTSGVTLTAPAGGTLELGMGMSVTVIMTASNAGDVIGQTVPA